MKKYRVLRNFLAIHEKGSIITDDKLENYCLIDKEYLEKDGYIEEMKEILVDEMKKGGVYRFIFDYDKGEQKIIFRFKEQITKEGLRFVKCNAILCNFDKKFIKGHVMDVICFEDTAVIATPKEIDWLERCEKAGGYVEKDFNFNFNEFYKKGYYRLKKENEAILEEKRILILENFKVTHENSHLKYEYEELKDLYKVKKKKKGVNFYLNQLPLNVDGHTFNMNRDEDGYSISYYKCTEGYLIFQQSKSFKKALKLTYKGLKKDGHIK